MNERFGPIDPKERKEMLQVLEQHLQPMQRPRWSRYFPAAPTGVQTGAGSA